MNLQTQANVEAFVTALYPEELPHASTFAIIGPSPTLSGYLSMLPAKGLRARARFLTLTNRSLVIIPKTGFEDPEQVLRVPLGQGDVHVVELHRKESLGKWSQVRLWIRGQGEAVRYNVMDHDLPALDHIVRAIRTG